MIWGRPGRPEQEGVRPYDSRQWSGWGPTKPGYRLRTCFNLIKSFLSSQCTSSSVRHPIVTDVRDDSGAKVLPVEPVGPEG